MRIKKFKTKYHKFLFQFDYNSMWVEKVKEIQASMLNTWKDFSFYKDEAGINTGWVFSSYAVYKAICEEFEPIVDDQVDILMEKIKREEQEQEEREARLSNVPQIEELNPNLKIDTLLPLFPFQSQTVDFVKKVGGRALLALDMGMGKSCCAIGYGVFKHYGSVLIICPSSVKGHWEREIMNFAGIKANNLTETKERGGWEIIGFPNLEKYYNYLKKQEYQLVIIDECFPYDTEVFTNKGWQRIGIVVEEDFGDMVLSWNIKNNRPEWKKIIKRKQQYYTEDFIKIETDKETILATPNHKFYVDGKGYKRAEEIKRGEILRIMREKDYETSLQKAKVLLSQLFGKMENGATRLCKIIANKRKVRKIKFKIKASLQKESSLGENIFGENEKEKPNVDVWDKRKNERKIIRDWPQTENPRREWETITIIATKIIRKFIRNRSWLGGGVGCKHKGFFKYLWENAKLLQNRYREQREKNSHRSRRIFSFLFREEKTRQKKRMVFTTARVENIKVQKRGDNQEYYWYKKENFVYNLEVEGNHNYFANGILVSNCHFIKNKSAIRTKKTLALLKNAKDILFLSGTPILNRPAEIYNVFNFIRPMPFWGNEGFAMRYCGLKQDPFGRWDYAGSSNLDELKEKMSFMIRMEKKDYLTQLPDKTINILETEMENWSDYRQIVSDFKEWLKDKKLNENAVFAEALTKVNYLKQTVVNNKNITSVIKEFLENGKKIIVFSQYKTVIDKLHAIFEEISVKLTGDTPSNARQDIIDQFQTNEAVRVFFSTIKAGGVGITLTEADTVLFTDLSWTPSDHQQAEDRAYRIGQKNNVNVYYLITPKTIEEKIWKLLKRKETMINKIMQGERSNKVHIKSLIKNL